MTCDPKINYFHFSAIELGGGGGWFFVGFHSGAMKERLVGFNFYKRAISLPLENENFMFLQIDCQNKTMVFGQYIYFTYKRKYEISASLKKNF